MTNKLDVLGRNDRKPGGRDSNGHPYKVLIIDDSIFIKKQLTQILTSEGFEVIETAGDGLEGFEKYKELHSIIDVVTMDITMPRLDGVSALEKIMEFDKDAIVIMVSALGKQDLVKKAFMLGAKNYIVKPLNRDKVLERIIQCVS